MLRPHNSIRQRILFSLALEKGCRLTKPSTSPSKFVASNQLLSHQRISVGFPFSFKISFICIDQQVLKSINMYSGLRSVSIKVYKIQSELGQSRKVHPPELSWLRRSSSNGPPRYKRSRAGRGIQGRRRKCLTSQLHTKIWDDIASTYNKKSC